MRTTTNKKSKIRATLSIIRTWWIWSECWARPAAAAAFDHSMRPPHCRLCVSCPPDCPYQPPLMALCPLPLLVLLHRLRICCSMTITLPPRRNHPRVDDNDPDLVRIEVNVDPIACHWEPPRVPVPPPCGRRRRSSSLRPWRRMPTERPFLWDRQWHRLVPCFILRARGCCTIDEDWEDRWYPWS